MIDLNYEIHGALFQSHGTFRKQQIICIDFLGASDVQGSGRIHDSIETTKQHERKRKTIDKDVGHYFCHLFADLRPRLCGQVGK